MDYNSFEAKNENWNPLNEELDVGESLLHILDEVRSLKEKFDKCAEENKNLIQTLKDEIQDLKNEVVALNPRKTPEFKLLPKLPFDCLQDLKDFDELLPLNDDLRQEVIKFIRRIEASDFTKFLRISLRSFVTDELAIHVTWRGTQEKPSIQRFTIFVLLRDTCHDKFPNAELPEINRVCQQHFLHAKDRVVKKKPGSAVPIPSFIPTVAAPPPIVKCDTPPIIVSPSPPPTPSVLPHMPFITLASLEEFDDKLLDDTKLKKALKQYVNRVGGKDHSAFLRAAFRAIMTDEVAMELTWRGTKEKQSIQEFTVFVIIRNACNAKFIDTNLAEINKVCQQHFLHARDRVNKRIKLY